MFADYLDNLISLDRVAYYQAPKVDKVTPFPIPQGVEYVEVLLGGKIFFTVEGEIRECRKGTIFWHIEGDYTLSDTDKDDPYRCMVFGFNVKHRKHPVPHVTYWEDTESLDKFSSEAISCFHNKDFDCRIMGSYLYCRLYWEAYKSRLHPMGTDYPHSLCKAVKYMERYAESDLTVEDIAAEAVVSKPYLFALFRKYLNCSPHKYLTNCRLNRAKTMLAGTTRSIKEIAAACGFESLESFYRAFKKNSGVPPATYRTKYSPYPRSLHD
ncbi:MAG: AraC family transcriptional regulator [Victivallaceae bacterium]|nr:AraC family transcriptional regulator [Victivallaceae bacterium]